MHGDTACGADATTCMIDTSRSEDGPDVAVVASEASDAMPYEPPLGRRKSQSLTFPPSPAPPSSDFSPAFAHASSVAGGFITAAHLPCIHKAKSVQKELRWIAIGEKPVGEGGREREVSPPSICLTSSAAAAGAAADGYGANRIRGAAKALCSTPATATAAAHPYTGPEVAASAVCATRAFTPAPSRPAVAVTSLLPSPPLSPNVPEAAAAAGAVASSAYMASAAGARHWLDTLKGRRVLVSAIRTKEHFKEPQKRVLVGA